MTKAATIRRGLFVFSGGVLSTAGGESFPPCPVGLGFPSVGFFLSTAGGGPAYRKQHSGNELPGTVFEYPIHRRNRITRFAQTDAVTAHGYSQTVRKFYCPPALFDGMSGRRPPWEEQAVGEGK